MARQTVHQLTEETAPLGTDVIPIGRVGRRLRKIKVSTLRPPTVKDFGAIGDGVTDDTAAIQAAIDAAIVAGRGAAVILPSPSGFYRISSELVVDDAVGLTIIGYGLPRIHQDTNSVNGLVITGDSSDIEVCGLRLTGTSAATVTGAGILAGYNSLSGNDDFSLSDIRIHDNYVEGFPFAGIHVNGYKDEELADFTIENVWVERNSISDVSAGIFVYKGLRDVHIGRNIVTDTDGPLIYCDTRSASGDSHTAFQIDGLHVCDNKGRRWAKTNSYTGFLIKGLVRNAWVSRNHLDTNGNQAHTHSAVGIIVQQEDTGNLAGYNINILDNIVRNIYTTGAGKSSNDGIQIRGGFRDVVIRGNTLENLGHSGVSVGNTTATAAENIIVENNVIRSVDSYHIDFRGNTAGGANLTGGSVRNNTLVVGTGTWGEAATLEPGILVTHADNYDVGPNRFVGFGGPRINAFNSANTTGGRAVTPPEKVIVTYAASFNPPFSLGTQFFIDCTGNLTVLAPPDETTALGERRSFVIKNSTGGALTVAWNTAFKLAGAWVSPANGGTRTISFEKYAVGVWVEVERAGGDITV